jgi:hypothetical protein
MAGCELGDQMPACTGTPAQCRDINNSECESMAGCVLEPGCIGATACRELGSQPQCEDATEMIGCQWVNAVCDGEGEMSSPCEEISLEQCAEVPGCRLEFPDE